MDINNTLTKLLETHTKQEILNALTSIPSIEVAMYIEKRTDDLIGMASDNNLKIIHSNKTFTGEDQLDKALAYTKQCTDIEHEPDTFRLSIYLKGPQILTDLGKEIEPFSRPSNGLYSCTYNAIALLEEESA